jgi:hypothetical protein
MQKVEISRNASIEKVFLAGLLIVDNIVVRMNSNLQSEHSHITMIILNR